MYDKYLLKYWYVVMKLSAYCSLFTQTQHASSNLVGSFFDKIWILGLVQIVKILIDERIIRRKTHTCVPGNMYRWRDTLDKIFSKHSLCEYALLGQFALTCLQQSVVTVMNNQCWCTTLLWRPLCTVMSYVRFKTDHI